MLSKSELEALQQLIKNATGIDENTATRIGTYLAESFTYHEAESSALDLSKQDRLSINLTSKAWTDPTAFNSHKPGNYLVQTKGTGTGATTGFPTGLPTPSAGGTLYYLVNIGGTGYVGTGSASTIRGTIKPLISGQTDSYEWVLEIPSGASPTIAVNLATKVAKDADVVALSASRAVFNVTIEVPLSAGQYYTDTTARAAVPTAVRKLGLEIIYFTAARVARKQRYIGADVSGWETAGNWQFVVINDLVTGGADVGLAAEQGKVLNGKILSQSKQATTLHDALFSFDNIVINNSGVATANIYNKTTDFIEIALLPYIEALVGTNDGKCLAFFDASQTYISGVSKVWNSTEILIYDSTNIPSTAKYFRASTNKYRTAGDFCRSTLPIVEMKLVNDVITGGTDKALTAEQGKVLNVRTNTIDPFLIYSGDMTVAYVGGYGSPTLVAHKIIKGKQYRIIADAIAGVWNSFGVCTTYYLGTPGNVNIDSVGKLVLAPNANSDKDVTWTATDDFNYFYFEAASSSTVIKVTITTVDDNEKAFYQLNKSKLQAFANSQLINDLTTGGATNYLSAEQGKQLNTKVEGVNPSIYSGDMTVAYVGGYGSPTLVAHKIIKGKQYRIIVDAIAGVWNSFGVCTTYYLGTPGNVNIDSVGKLVLAPNANSDKDVTWTATGNFNFFYFEAASSSTVMKVTITTVDDNPANFYKDNKIGLYKIFDTDYKMAILSDSIHSNQVSNVGGALKNELGFSFLQANVGDESTTGVGNITTEFGNLGVGGAILCDTYSGSTNLTQIVLEKQANGIANNNTISNQVRRLLQHTTALGAQIQWTHPYETLTGGGATLYTESIPTDKGTGRGYTTDLPGIIVIAASANDMVYSDDADTVISQKYQDLKRDTIASALRWAIETLQINYPNAIIFVNTPLQCGDNFRSHVNMYSKAQIIKKVCDFMSVKCINLFGEVGINRKIMPTYSSDLIHPNPNAVKIISKYEAEQIRKFVYSRDPNHWI